MICGLQDVTQTHPWAMFTNLDLRPTDTLLDHPQVMSLLKSTQYERYSFGRDRWEAHRAEEPIIPEPEHPVLLLRAPGVRACRGCASWLASLKKAAE